MCILCVCAEIMHRLPTATYAVRQCLLSYVLPWLYNMELVDSSLPATAASTVDRHTNSKETELPGLLRGRGWGSPEATDLILNNLLYTTVTVSDRHNKRLQSFEYASTIGHGGVNKWCEQT